ncbi:MAG: hypothetical protein J5806_03295 [Lentisphaeria bacterium]|nr:hypothetical protein [Lentisphaeria bacterium]
MKKVIVLPKDRGPLDESAGEFLRYWEKITGEKLQTIRALPRDRKQEVILFGTDSQNPAVHELMLAGKLPQLAVRHGSDDYLLRSFETPGCRGLLVMGGNVRAYFYAVYDFFERSGACRYFWDGDRIIPNKRLSLRGFDVYEKPGFDYRGTRYFAHRGLHRFQAEHWDLDDWKREIDWLLKKRLNLMFIRTGVEDLFQRAFPDAVPYPRFGEKAPERQRNSYLDRTPFWKLQYRAKMLREVYAYARSRGLLLPTDCGTMTHWYSLTPPEFLKKYDPGFIPEQVRYNGCPEGRVWDVERDANMANYWKLSEVQLKEYGTSELFHTIGLAERRCFPDHARNHYFKRYAFRRIEDELRKHYPQAPLLVSTWDFIATWNPEEIREFVAELNPENTLLLDYTSDIFRENHNFLNWDIVGKFPWIYGIFHAYEASNELRGNYDNIARRFPAAVADPMCKGMVFWSENSHADTLMLEYFSRLAWTRKTIRIEDFIGEFCSDRYPAAEAEKMAELWRKALPLIKASLWGEAGPLAGEPIREVYPHMYFQLLNRGSYCWSLGELDEERQEFHRHTVKQLSPLMSTAAECLKTIASWPDADGFLFRDRFDLARTVAIRMFDYALSAFALALETWQLDPVPKNRTRVRTLVGTITKMTELFSRLLAASEEFSLAYSLDRLKSVSAVNPVFEDTFKRGAVSPYCRSFTAETAAYCYEAEWQYLARRAEKCLKGNDTRPWRGLLEEFEQADRGIVEAFAARSLEEMRPQVEAARKNLPGVLLDLAALIPVLRKQEVPYVIF